VVQEGHGLSETDVRLLAMAAELVIFDKGNAVTDIVQILGRLHDGLEQVVAGENAVSGSLLPEREEVMLK